MDSCLVYDRRSKLKTGKTACFQLCHTGFISKHTVCSVIRGRKLHDVVYILGGKDSQQKPHYRNWRIEWTPFCHQSLPLRLLLVHSLCADVLCPTVAFAKLLKNKQPTDCGFNTMALTSSRSLFWRAILTHKVDDADLNFWCAIRVHCTQDYKSLCAAGAGTICAILLDIQTHRQHLTSLYE